LLSACFNPLVSLPDANFTREALQKLEFLGVVDFFMSETAHYADVVLAGSLQEEEEGIGCTAEGRVIHIQKAVDPPGNAKGDSWICGEVASGSGKERFFRYPWTRETYDGLREAWRGGHADFFGTPSEKTAETMAVFGRVRRLLIPEHRDSSRTAGRFMKM